MDLWPQNTVFYFKPSHQYTFDFLSTLQEEEKKELRNAQFLIRHFENTCQMVPATFYTVAQA